MKRGIVERVKDAVASGNTKEAKALVTMAKKWKSIAPKTLRKLERLVAE